MQTPWGGFQSPLTAPAGTSTTLGPGSFLVFELTLSVVKLEVKLIESTRLHYYCNFDFNVCPNMKIHNNVLQIEKVTCRS